MQTKSIIKIRAEKMKIESIRKALQKYNGKKVLVFLKKNKYGLLTLESLFAQDDYEFAILNVFNAFSGGHRKILENLKNLIRILEENSIISII